MNRQKPFPRNPCRGAQQGSCSHLRTQGRSVGFYHSGVSGPVVWWNSWLVAFFLGYRDTPSIYLCLHLYTVYIYTYIYIYIYIYALFIHYNLKKIPGMKTHPALFTTQPFIFYTNSGRNRWTKWWIVSISRHPITTIFCPNCYYFWS